MPKKADIQLDIEKLDAEQIPSPFGSEGGHPVVRKLKEYTIRLARELKVTHQRVAFR